MRIDGCAPRRRANALAGLARVRLAQALDNPFVGLPVDSAVQALMVRAAAELADCGVRRINVSIDTLDPDKFKYRITARELTA